jgi:hypothetical protein
VANSIKAKTRLDAILCASPEIESGGGASRVWDGTAPFVDVCGALALDRAECASHHTVTARINHPALWPAGGAGLRGLRHML